VIDTNQQKNERSESGFDSINDGIFNINNQNCIHIPLNIPLPPSREPPRPPVMTDYSPQNSPMPTRKKLHKQPIPDINYIQSTPSPVLKGNDFLIEKHCDEERNQQESEIKIDELNVGLNESNVRKEGIISDKIKNEEMEDFEIKVYPKDRM
jgi:hypothetical protein